MPNVDKEKKIQDRVIRWLIKQLGYTYLGNFQDKNDNPPVREDLLTKWLQRQMCHTGWNNRMVTEAVRKLVTAVDAQDAKLYDVNEAVYFLLRYGCPVKAPNESANYTTVNYIDWRHPENNDFYVAEEVNILRSDGRHHNRPDLVLYVNGIALAMFELKRSSVSVGDGIRQLIGNQRKEFISKFFGTMQMLFAGNESQGLFYGTIETPEKYYLQWREDEDAKDHLSAEISKLTRSGSDDDVINKLRQGVLSLCHKPRLLEIIHDFVIFDDAERRKKVPRHNQYFAVLAARSAIKKNRGGIIWDTQGSGKSLIMVWLTKWIVENINESRVVLITDRQELDRQLEGLFSDIGEKLRRAKSCADLRDILNTTQDTIVSSLIHKYGHSTGNDDNDNDDENVNADIELYKRELLDNLPSDFKAKGNIIAFIDECHRTNSGKLHEAVKTLMPGSILIGFTGTPLLRKDKKTSLETFGGFIHCYKYDKGVRDKIILDLRYEARDVNQYLGSPARIDQTFEARTKHLTDKKRDMLKQKWASMENLFASHDRLDRIVADILFDMETKPRLATGCGTAMLVTSSIYNACRYWEIFTSHGFTKCAVVTSYEPTAASVQTTTSDLNADDEENYKRDTYLRMLDGKSTIDFEREVIELFKRSPSKMKLLIVVDKLLTGFDAPSATYLYVDTPMRDHTLFQAICRVNRPDGDDKDFGYIVDYMDLFKNLNQAVTDYTDADGALGGYDKDDIENMIRSRYDDAVAKMHETQKSLADLFEQIENPESDAQCIHYFCGTDPAVDINANVFADRRKTFYSLTARLTRSFASCVDRLVTHYGYTDAKVQELRKSVLNYNRIKTMVKLACGDKVDLTSSEPDMRYILDSYVHADDAEIIGKLGEFSLTQLIAKHSLEKVIDEIPCDENARAEIIENNLKFELVQKRPANPAIYAKLSQMLDDLIQRRRKDVIDYKAYLAEIEKIVTEIAEADETAGYPESVKNSAGSRALYDYFVKLAEATDGNTLDPEIFASKLCAVIGGAEKPGWRDQDSAGRAKQNRIRRAISETLKSLDVCESQVRTLTEDIFDTVVMRQDDDTWRNA